MIKLSYFQRRWAASLALASALTGFVSFAALAQHEDDLAGVSDTFDAAELIPSAAAALPPILSGQEAGARERGAAVPVPPPADSAREWFGVSDWWTWQRATGDWGGGRTALEDAGIVFSGSLISEWSDVFHGGTADNSAFRFLLDLNMSVELEKLVGLKGGSIFIDFQTANTGHGAMFDGGLQTYSNIAIDGSITQLSQAWYEQWLFEEVLRIKVGKVDANTEFAYIPAAGGFINASAGFTPTIFALPTYPNASTSFNAFVYPSEHTYIGTGIYDGATAVDGVPTGSRGPSTFFSDDVSDDWFFIAETGIVFEELGSLNDVRAGVGGWWHTGDFTTFSGGNEDGAGGFYALAEARVWGPEAEETQACCDCCRGLFVFAQYGWANDRVSIVTQQIGGGVSLIGTFAGRDEDSTGLYISYADFTNDPAAGYGASETSFELFYDFALTPALHIKPDLQYFMNPSGDASIDNALVGTLRLTIVF